MENLELVVLEGHGQKLLTENASDNKVRQFLKSVPGYIVRTLGSQKRKFAIICFLAKN